MKNLLAIGNSVTVFFSILLAFSVSIIIFLNTDSGEIYSSNNSFPRIEINNFTLYQMDSNSLTLQIDAMNAKQYDLFEEFSNIVMKRYINRGMDIISAPIAIKKNDMLFFNDGLGYNKEDYVFHTQEGVYYIRDSILKGSRLFSIKNEYQTILGDDIYYDSKNGLIQAYNIKATFKSK